MTINRREDSGPSIRRLLGTDDAPPRRRSAVYEYRVVGWGSMYVQVGWVDEPSEPETRQIDDPEAPA